MRKYMQKQLKNLVKNNIAIDVTNSDRKAINEPYTQIGYSVGVYGCNGMLLKGLESGKLYAVTRRTLAFFAF